MNSLEQGNAQSELKRGIILEILPSGEISAILDDAPESTVRCDFLETTSADPPRLSPGDRVVIVMAGGRPCVIGRVGAYPVQGRKTLTLEAGEELTLQCGEGRIVIRKSGKILIQGLDIVSHAKRQNRVRGGSIHLN